MDYNIGDVARLSVLFTDVNGAPADPTTVTLTVWSPDNTQDVYTDATTPIVVHPSTGAYYLDLPVTQAGPNAYAPAYIYRWTGTGSLMAVEEGWIAVSPTLLIPQPPPDPPEFTAASLVAIDKAIASGALTVRFQDRTVEYRSADELLKLRSLIKNWLALNSGTIIRQSRVFSGKGW